MQSQEFVFTFFNIVKVPAVEFMENPAITGYELQWKSHCRKSQYGMSTYVNILTQRWRRFALSECFLVNKCDIVRLYYHVPSSCVLAVYLVHLSVQ